MKDTDGFVSEPDSVENEEVGIEVPAIDEDSILQMELTAANQEIESLKEALKAVEEKQAEAEKKQLYIQAEFQTYRRRREDEAVTMQKYVNGEFAKTLLPAIDNLERAMQAADVSSNFESLKSGVAGTLKQLLAAFERTGIIPINAIGEEFNPEFHEAIEHIESDEFPPHSVAHEVQRGYMIHDRVLRASLVRVVGE